MGVDTHAFIVADSNKIFDLIKMFDKEARMETHNFRPNDPDNRLMYTIDFNFCGESRSINIHDMQFGGIYVDKEEKWYYKKYQTTKESSSYTYNKMGVPDKTPGVLCSVGMWGISIILMDLLGSYFGGWVDENDCDNTGFRETEDKYSLVGGIFDGRIPINSR